MQEGRCGNFPSPINEASEERNASHALVSGEAWALDVPPLDFIPIYHVINFTASASKARTPDLGVIASVQMTMVGVTPDH